jgi:TRAP transporter 4TM/12TM fusion protein
MPQPVSSLKASATFALSALLCAFTLAEVNYPQLSPASQLAVFALLGLTLCFLNVPASARFGSSKLVRALDGLLVLATVASCGYVVWQTEPMFAASWFDGRSLGNRAGYETPVDIAMAVLGIVVVLEAARRTIGLTLPLLAGAFLLYAYLGPSLPGWLFPHRGYPVERIVAQSFLHTQGVFGVALSVMFTYVFLFVVFGAVLAQTGATRFVIDFAARTFGRTPGGPAKVAVVSSGLMGSVSGSAVANVATTGLFTIPMMRRAGFSPTVAGAVEAAASSGGALVPPVMGAGAYMMIELVQPPVSYLDIIRAALVPAILFYLSLFMYVHFHARRLALAPVEVDDDAGGRDASSRFAGIVFACSLATLMGLLALGFTAFRAVSVTLAVMVAASFVHRSTRLDWPRLRDAIVASGKDVVPLVAASACVGIIIAVVMLTGVGTRLPGLLLPLAEQHLVLALAAVMVSSLVLGMGLPSAVVYLLLATLVGPVLSDLGAQPLAVHLFIFYFGMLSMVTPPVALAGYTAASIAGANIMATSLAAFRISLVGFSLPYIFVFRPELLLLPGDAAPSAGAFLGALVVAVLGVVAFAAALAGYLFARLTRLERLLLFVAAALLLAPGPSVVVAGVAIPVLDTAGLVVGLVAAVPNRRRAGAPAGLSGEPDLA